MATFLLSCESTIDLPYSHTQKRNISVLFYSYSLGGQTYRDNMDTDPEGMNRFWQAEREGIIPTTSQINEFTYEEYFRSLPTNVDILHIALGSGITPAVFNAVNVAKKLNAENPARSIQVIDSTCASSGYGMLVEMTADWRDEGLSMTEVITRVKELCPRIHHEFFSTDLKYFMRTGRLRSTIGTIASVLNICPIMREDNSGKLIVYSKVRGKKHAVSALLKRMETMAENGYDYSGLCFISHSDMQQDAEALKAAIEERFTRLREAVRICHIGTVISAHTGPGVISLFFVSNNPRE